MRFVPILNLALAAALPLSALAQPAQEKPLYKLKAEAPHTGTSILHDLAIANFPYDKPYAKLSADDRQMLRALYEHMGPDDEPPFPLRGYKTIFKALSEIQRNMLITGELDIAITVDANGDGTSVTIYKTPDADMARMVATLMMIEKYKPALCSGKPCAQAFPFRAHFTVSR